jgi:hypothetical protein
MTSRAFSLLPAEHVRLEAARRTTVPDDRAGYTIENIIDLSAPAEIRAQRPPTPNHGPPEFREAQ